MLTSVYPCVGTSHTGVQAWYLGLALLPTRRQLSMAITSSTCVSCCNASTTACCPLHRHCGGCCILLYKTNNLCTLGVGRVAAAYGGSSSGGCPANYPSAAPTAQCAHISFVELDAQQAYRQVGMFGPSSTLHMCAALLMASCRGRTASCQPHYACHSVLADLLQH